MPNRFDNSALVQQAQQPAAPKGLRQAARDAQDAGAPPPPGYGRPADQANDRFAGTTLGQEVREDNSYVPNAQSWYTGANQNGISNGWDTDFWNRAMAQNQAFGEQGILAQQFEQPDATGVVTWDHTSTDGRHTYHFGDVYDNGKLSGNVFDQFDRGTANLMMADILFDASTKAHIFQGVEIDQKTGKVTDDGGLDAAVQGKREQNNTDIPKAYQAQEFQADVAEGTNAIEQGVNDVFDLVGLGDNKVAQTAAMMAGGGLISGLGVSLNRDALAEQAARAKEITDMSGRENGGVAQVFTGINQWGGFAGRLALSPMSNTVQGLTDARMGRVGDGVSEFYRVDAKGDSVVPKWVKVADVGAAITDAALQFSNPIGAGLYQAQMSAVIAGESGELIATGGKSFDYSRGGFDSIFTDDDGSFSPLRALAGIGKVGIDVAQLGMARGLLSKTQHARAAAGEEVVGGTGKTLLSRIGQRLYGGAPKAAEREAAGFRFTLDETGKATGKRMTLSLLAPSEQLQALSARVLAMRTTAKARGALTADDIYRASSALASGEKRLTTALVTGMGEGYEEAIQQVLDPYSHSASISMSDIANSAVYGFAAGAGMGAGIGFRMPSSADKMFALAQVGHSLMTGGEVLDRRTYNSWSPSEQQARAALAGMPKSVADASFKKIVDDQSAEYTAGVVGIHKLASAIQAQLTSNLKTRNPRTDGAFVITQLEDAGRVDADGNLLPGYMPADAIGASGVQTVQNMVNHMRGVAVQLTQLNRDLDQVNAQLASDPANQELLDKQAELTAQIGHTETVLRLGKELNEDLEAQVKQLYYDPATGYTPTSADILAGTEAINAVLRDMFHERVATDLAGNPLSPTERRALAQAVSIVFARDPHDSAGSYQVLLPQISAKLTAEDTNDFAEVSHAILSAIRGDFDGDKVRPLNTLILNDEAYTAARSGAHFVGAGTSVNVGTPKYEKQILTYLGTAINGSNQALANFAEGTLATICASIRQRYAGTIEPEVVDEILLPFYNAARAGEADTRQILLDGLATKAGGAITTFARGNLSNEWLWIDTLIKAQMDAFQEGYAAHRPDAGPATNNSVVLPNRQTPEVKERLALNAATKGGTVGLLFAGDAPFRQSQKLHYSSLVAAVLSAENAGTREQLYALAQLYEALGQGLATSELDAVRAKDDITARVYARLERVSRDAQELDPTLTSHQALAVVANLRVDDIDQLDDGSVQANGKQISLAQFLLKQSLEEWRDEVDLVYDASPEMQAKYNRLDRMTKPDGQGRKGSKVNSSRAFVEVISSQQLFTLLGDEALVFGPHLTVEQFIRAYVAMDEHQRRSTDRKLQGEAAYLEGNRDERHNPPYDLAEVAAGEISPFRAVVDAVLAVGHNRITIDPKVAAATDLSDKHLHGELAERSYETGKSLRDGITRIRAALAEFAGLSGRREGELTREMVQRLFESNPDVARLVMNLIPNGTANAVLFRTETGEVVAANWLFDTFVIKDPVKAEMHYWRNLLLAELNALGVTGHFNEQATDEAERGRGLDLPRRMHRLVNRLALAPDGGLLLKKFIDQMESATSVEGFMRWVNTFPGIRGEQAPLTAWVDDVAEFDQDKAAGGWTTNLQGAELREAIASLQRGAKSLVDDLAEERAALKADTRVLAAVKRVIDYDNGARKKAPSTDDRDLYNRFEAAITEAGERAVGLGPAAMVYQTIAAAQGFYPQAHTKGKNPDFLDPAGALEAHRDAYGYVTNYERVMAALTSVNISAVNNNMSELAKDGARFMDDYGRTVEWTQPTPAQMLELLSNQDTRPAARAILFPQVLERDFDGQTRPKLLVGKSLKSLLRGTSHADLFPKNDRLDQEAALKYVAMVEAEARRFGGHFSVQRVANDLVIARTSAADHVLSVAELERMTIQAYREIAQVLQATGGIAAAAHKPGVDPLAALATKVRDDQRAASKASRVSLATGETEDRELAELVMDELVKVHQDQLIDQQTELTALAAATTDPGEQARLIAQADALAGDMARFQARLQLLLDDNMAQRVVEMFTISGDPTDQAAKKDQLVSYVTSHLSMMERSSSSLLLLDKLTRQLADPAYAGQPNLSTSEWTQLSRAVIGVYIDDLTSTTAVGVSVPPFPENENDQRYYDTSFSYLADKLIEGDSPLVKAAAHIHRLAKRGGAPVATETEVGELLGRTLFKDFGFGRWTSEIPRASIEANARLDSAAAPVAISMYGNSPKTQAVISAATRRSFQVPGEELLSSVTLRAADLRNSFDEVDVMFPGGVVGRRPLVQLNNRFARSVQLQFVDKNGEQQSVDLLATDQHLGRVWHTNDVPANSGYQSIDINRLHRSVDMALDGADPSTARVEVSFFHPDSQPAGPEWMHNLFFEGTSFQLDADRHDNLNSTLWFANGSISPAGQAMALDAAKLGQPAMKVVDTPSAERRSYLEAYWAHDLAAVLRMKTRELLESDLGFGTLEKIPGTEFYNAVYKNLKLRHFVRTGGQVMTAEDFIALQQSGAEVPDDAVLWVPSDDVLRSLLGEQGTQGVARIFDDQLEIDLAKVPTFKGITETMVQRFNEGMVRGEAAELTDTPLVNRARQQLLDVRPYLSDQQRSAYDAKMKFFRAQRDEIYGDRAAWAGRTDRGGFDPRTNMEKFLRTADKALRAENIAFDWSQAGISFIGPRMTSESELGQLLLHELNATLDPNDFRSGWIYREGGDAHAAHGLLSEVNLSGKEGALRVAPGDLVFVELDSFTGEHAEDKAKKRLDYLVDHGAIVVLGAQDGSADMRVEMANYLESRNYERYAGSGYVYRPIEMGSRYQNLKARASTQMEVRGVSRRSHVALFVVPDQAIEESAGWVNSDNPRLSSVATVLNLVPVGFLGGFNVPVEGFETQSQIAKVIAQLRSLDNPEGRALLREMANGAPADDPELDDALTRMFDRFDATGQVMPQPGDTFGTGDILPLTDGHGRILLYRHGMMAPTRAKVDKMAATTMPDRNDALNVAVYPSRPEPAATTHRGEVIAFKRSGVAGLQVELDVDLSTLGDKLVLEWNGMKYLLSPKPDSIVLPDHGFFPDWAIDLIVSAHDVASKESFDGLVNNHRNAFAYFGIDFLPDVAKFLGVETGVARDVLRAIATRAPRVSVQAADEMLGSLRQDPGFLNGVSRIALEFPEVGKQLLAQLQDNGSVEAQITRAMMLYLSVPGARVDDVLQSGGFNDDSANLDSQSRLMPRLFTQVFDNAPLNSPLRTEMNKRFNDQLHNPNNDGTGYSLSQTWQFEIRNADPAKNLTGMLQFAEAHSAGDNPVKNGMAFDEREQQAVSQHSAAIAYQAISARTAMSEDIAKARAFASGEGIHRFDSKDQLDGGAWRLLTDLSPKARKAAAPWRAQTMAEAEYRARCRDDVTKYRQPVDVTADTWDEPQRLKRVALATQTLHQLGLRDSQVELFDFWVRQMAGADERITGKEYLEAAEMIRDNVVTYRVLPLVGAEVPLLHAHDLQLLHRVQQNRGSEAWAPRKTLDGDATASSWDEWVQVSLGSMFLTDDSFEPLYRSTLDGFLHTYQNATAALLDIPVSVDKLVAQKLLEPETNAMLAISIDKNVDLALREPMLLQVATASIDDLLGGVRVAGKSKSAPASERAKRRGRIRKFRKENGVPFPVDATLKDIAANGQQFTDRGTATNALSRMLINMRVGTALINPALYVSMGPEQWIRGTLDNAANLLTGQATGATGQLAAAVHLSRYTPDQVKGLQRLYQTMGERNDFKAMVFKELMFLRPHQPGISRVEKWLEGYAKFGSRMQDPTWGMRAQTLARRYLDGALQHINATPSLNVLTLDRLIAEMSTNPTFLREHFPDAHQAGANAVAQIRSLKQTTGSHFVRGIYEPMSESSNGVVNMFGNVVLKLPLLFSNYAMNVATTITGMQGVDQMLAMFLHGRDKGLIGRIQRRMRGDAYNPELDDNFDYSDVIEGIDLTRAFIRGGLTHAGLFSLGMIAGGLGLSGEDDETKKRRRMAELQGAGFIYDPRRIENDFRNSDAVFLDWLPGPLENYFRVTTDKAPGGARSMAQLHWMLKQFVSPIIGMEKFYETGDFRHVTWGFEDALGSFPLINTLMWDDAVSTAGELAAMADDEQQLGGPTNLVASAGFLTNAVGVYERMLFENSFVNMLYVGHDRYDRDPYALPLRDSDGELQKDIEGNARRQNLSLEKFVDPETGMIREGYQGRDQASGLLHALTENRASLAAFMWLMPGGGDDYWRYNMPIKTREIALPDVSKDEAEAFVRAASQGMGGMPNLTADELASIWKAQYKEAGIYVDYDKVDAEAAAFVARQDKGYSNIAPMSVLDKAGREVLTKDGARAVLTGLAKGSVQLGDASLGGIYITAPMREEIQKEWMKELIQEGVDMGLDQTKATSRMKRLWFGPIDDPSVQGLGDILWSKDISYDDKATYNQLNTTYVLGPDGRPWATGWTRDGLMGALGLKPLKRQYLSEQGATGNDNRLNTTDLVNGVNTGLRALELVDESRNVPTDVEIGKAIEAAIKEAAADTYSPFQPFGSSSSGYGGYYGGGYYGGGYGGYGGYRHHGYGSSGGYANYSRMYALPGGTAPYANNIPFINTTNPIIRRADIRRERVWSERGRLKQWQ